MTKAQKERADLDKNFQATQASLAYARNIFSTPAGAALLVERLKAEGKSIPPELAKIANGANAPPDDPDDIDTRINSAVAKSREEWRIEQEKERLAESLGQGDRVKGRALLGERYNDYLNVMDEITKADMPRLLQLASELHSLRAGRSAPPPPAPEPSSGTAATDLGRGTASPAPVATGPLTPDAYARAAGFANARDFERAMLVEDGG